MQETRMLHYTLLNGNRPMMICAIKSITTAIASSAERK